MKRKNKLKGLTMSVVALGAISVVPIVTTSCSKEEEPVDYSDEEITDEQYQEQADTIADIKDAIAAIENGTYSKTLSEVVSEIKSYEYFDEIVNFGDDIYNNDGSYNNNYISSIKTSIYEPFENKNILFSYDQFCVLIDSDYEYWGEENTLQEEDYDVYGIQTNINLIAFLDNKENLLLLPYFEEDGKDFDESYKLIDSVYVGQGGDLDEFVGECVNGVGYFLYDEPDESGNFTNYFSNYYELAEKLFDSIFS